jgi:cytochrome d ubiquinol oxidase subunit I
MIFASRVPFSAAACLRRVSRGAIHDLREDERARGQPEPGGDRFEMGLLWPAFTADFGSVFGLGFAIEGFSFFVEAIFIGIYIYGWNRLSPRVHFATGIPIAVAGVVGSFMVISVNAWMNHPGGFTMRDGNVVDVHPVQALLGNT